MLLKEITISCITPSAENWIKDLLSIALPTRARPSFPHSQSLPSGSFHKPLILIHQRVYRMKNHSHRKLTNWSHGPQPCLTQCNYEPCYVGPPKMNRSWWRVLKKHGSLEKGLANHFSILALRTPWTAWTCKNRRLMRRHKETGGKPECALGAKCRKCIQEERLMDWHKCCWEVK